jgi:hypothetical protein
MKTIIKILFVITLFNSYAYAGQTSVEAIGGGITYHVIDDGASSKYVTKWSSDGRLIFNQLYGIKYIDEFFDTYWSMALFGGNNSIGAPMTGAMGSLGFVWGNFNYGLAMGGYLQDDNAFRSKGIEPYRLSEFGNTGLVPILGAEINYKVDLSNRVYLRLNNLVSPVITNTSLSIGYRL